MKAEPRSIPGTLRQVPEDFLVDEVVPPRHEQEGEHLHLLIEKRGLTTDAAVNRIARHLGVRPGSVGRCGRKDARAVTRQWLSLQGVERAAAEQLELEGVRVLEAVRLPRKLRLGRFLGNRFEIRVRDFDTARFDEVQVRFDELVRRGLPNAFGRQRYGREGDNATIGRLLLRGELEAALERLLPKEQGPWAAKARAHLAAGRISHALRAVGRRTLAFCVSALQAEVFDRVLIERGEDYDRPLTGDLFESHASGRLVPFEQLADMDEARRRVQALELSPTGPLIGPDAREPRDEALALERRVVAGCEVDSSEGVDRFGMQGSRRPLRVPVTEVSARLGVDAAGDCLVLGFRLPPGAFATTLLDRVSAGGFGGG